MLMRKRSPFSLIDFQEAAAARRELIISGELRLDPPMSPSKMRAMVEHANRESEERARAAYEREPELQALEIKARRNGASRP